MKREFTLTLDGVEYPVAVEGDTITVNGRPFAVEVADDGAACSKSRSETMPTSFPSLFTTGRRRNW